jgi:hypothetical protein
LGLSKRHPALFQLGCDVRPWFFEAGVTTSLNMVMGVRIAHLQLRKAFHCNGFGLCLKCWPENFQFSSVNLCHKAIILLKLTQKMDKTL